MQPCWVYINTRPTGLLGCCTDSSLGWHCSVHACWAAKGAAGRQVDDTTFEGGQWCPMSTQTQVVEGLHDIALDVMNGSHLGWMSPLERIPQAGVSTHGHNMLCDGSGSVCAVNRHASSTVTRRGL